MIMTVQRLETIDHLCSALQDLPTKSDAQVGQMIAIGLEEIEERVGAARWAKMKELVSSFVESAIKAHAGPRDVFLRVEDGSYVIVFQGVSNDSALLIASKIAMQVNKTLFGQDGFEGASIRTVVSEGESWKTSETMKPKDIANRLAENAHKLASAPPPEEALKNNNITQAIPNPPDLDVKPDRKELRKQFALEMAEIEKTPSFLVFVALWSVPTETILGYKCIPARKNPYDDEMLMAYNALPFDAKQQDVFAFDIETLEDGLMQLKKVMASGHHRINVVFNISFETLSARHGRDDLTAVLRMVPPALRQRIYANLCDIPEGIPPSRLMELYLYLTPFFRDVAVVMRHSKMQGSIKNTLSRLHAAGVRMVGIELPSMPTNLEIEWTKSTLALAKQLGLITKVINVTRWSDALAFAEGGVQLISGPVLVTPSRKLLPPKRLTIAEVRNRVNEDTNMDDMARIKSSVG